MSKKNYSKMYAAEEEQAVVEAPVEDMPVPAVEETPVEKPVVKKKPKTVKGAVVNCAKLNVREQMNTAATVLCVIEASDEVKVFAEENHDGWVHVITNDGLEGFCMKQYIAIKQ